MENKHWKSQGNLLVNVEIVLVIVKQHAQYCVQYSGF